MTDNLNTTNSNLSGTDALMFFFLNGDVDTPDEQRAKVVPHLVRKELQGQDALIQKTANSLMELYALHTLTHQQSANILYDLKQSLDGTGAFTKLLDANILPYTKQAVYDLLAARDWLNKDATTDAEDLSWYEAKQRLSFRTMRIMASAEEKQLAEIKGLAKVGHKITETTAKSIINGTKPELKEHRQIRAKAKWCQTPRWQTEERASEQHQWFDFFENELRRCAHQMTERAERGPAPGKPGVLGYTPAEQDARLDSLTDEIIQEGLRYAASERLLAIRNFIDARIAVQKEQKADADGVITITATPLLD